MKIQYVLNMWGWTTNVTCITTWLFPHQWAACSTGRMSTICIYVHRQAPDVKRLDLTVLPFSPRSLNSLNPKAITYGIYPIKAATQLFFLFIQHQTPLAGRHILCYIDELRKVVIIKMLLWHTGLCKYSKVFKSLWASPSHMLPFSSLFGAQNVRCGKLIMNWTCHCMRTGSYLTNNHKITEK